MGYSTQMVTASNVAGKAYTVVVMLSMGVSMGVQPFLGYQRGKGDWHRMRQGVLWAMGMGTALCLAACVFLLLGGGWFIRLFSSEPLVVEIGERCVRAFLLSTPFLGISMVLLSYLQASGKMFRGMLVSLSRQFLAFFPLLILLNSFFGLDGMIYVQPLSDLVTTALAVAFSLPSLLGKWPVLSHSSPCAL